MHRIDTPTASPDLFGPGKAGFVGGDPLLGQASTAMSPEWCNDVQESLIRLIEAAGMTPEKGNYDQLTEAFSFLADHVLREQQWALQRLQASNWSLLAGLGERAVRCLSPMPGGWLVGTNDGVWTTDGFFSVHSPVLAGRMISSVATDFNTGDSLVSCLPDGDSPVLWMTAKRGTWDIDISTWRVDGLEVTRVGRVYALAGRWLVEVSDHADTVKGWMTSLDGEIWASVAGAALNSENDRVTPHLVEHDGRWFGVIPGGWIEWQEHLGHFVESPWIEGNPWVGLDRIVWWPSAERWLGWTTMVGDHEPGTVIATAPALDAQWSPFSMATDGRPTWIVDAAPVGARVLMLVSTDMETTELHETEWVAKYEQAHANGLLKVLPPKNADIIVPGPGDSWLIGAPNGRLARSLILPTND